MVHVVRLQRLLRHVDVLDNTRITWVDKTPDTPLLREVIFKKVDVEDLAIIESPSPSPLLEVARAAACLPPLD